MSTTTITIQVDTEAAKAFVEAHRKSNARYNSSSVSDYKISRLLRGSRSKPSWTRSVPVLRHVA